MILRFPAGKIRKARGLAVTIAITFLALNAVILLVISSLNIYFNFKNQQEMIYNQQQLVTKNAAYAVNEFIQDKLTTLRNSISFGGIATASLENKELLLDKLLGEEPSFRQLILLDERKQESLRVSRMSHLVKGQLTTGHINTMFDQARNGKRFASPAYIDEITGEPMLVLAAPVTDVFGDFKGIMMAEVNLKFMRDLINSIKVGKNGLAYVTDKEGNLIAYRDISRVLKAENVRHLAGVSSFMKNRTQRASIPITRGIQGNYVSVAYAPLGTPDWAVIVELPVSEAYKSVIGNIILSIVAMLMSFILTILLSVYLSRRITRPLINLRDAIRKISKGDRATEIKIESRDEIGELAGSFNQMVTDLRATTVSIEELRKEQKRFQDMAYIMADWIWEVDENGVYTYCSDKVKDIMGYTREEMIGKTAFDFMPPDETERVKEEFLKKANNSEMVKDFENWNITKDGRRVCSLTSGVPVFDAQGNCKGYRGVDKDITEKKIMEELLQKEKERLSVTLRSIGDGVIATDVDGKIVLLNRVAEALTGWVQEEAVGRPVDEVFRLMNEVTRCACESPVKKALETQSIVTLSSNTNTVLVSREGMERIIENSVAPIRDKKSRIIGSVIVFRDITENRKMQQEQIRSQKLESIGILAGGIAHDFNNILMGVTSNISVAKTYIAADGPLQEICSEMEQASRQAKALTKQLLTFAKGGAPIKKFADIPKLVEEATRFALRGSNVKAQFSISAGILPVEVDKEQIGQVINNIVLNAVQAMPEGGDIAVDIENGVELLECDLALRSDKFVKITIKDTGVGIPREHLSKIFDPYFTTKQKGNGLGLATTFSIIRNHHGRITVESEMGKGSRFIIYLPAAEGALPPQEEKTTGLTAGKGKILVMDDEELVRIVTGRIVNMLGYSVELARDGQEAIVLYTKAKEARENYDAVIMDLTVPGAMGGKELVKRLQEIDPAVKAIAASGYSTDEVMSAYRDYGFANILIKPFTIEEISAVLNDVFGKKES